MNFFNKILNKFILLLRKAVYPYEYMANWERLGKNLDLETILDFSQGTVKVL